MHLRFFMLLVIVVGCSDSVAPKKKQLVPIEEAPAVVLEAAKAKEPTVNFDRVIKTDAGFYEVQGKTKTGKIIEVEVSEAGEVLKVE